MALAYALGVQPSLSKLPNRFKIVSWNVASLRAVIRKKDWDSLIPLEADIICLQEIRCSPKQVPAIIIQQSGYCYRFWSPGTNKYSGVGMASKLVPLKVQFGIEGEYLDRIMVADFGKFRVVNVYSPFSGKEFARLDFRRRWERKFREHLSSLPKTTPVIVCGDFNVGCDDLDVHPTERGPDVAGFTDEERSWFRELLALGFTDAFRRLHPYHSWYSFWAYGERRRERNIGWRLDYFLLNESGMAGLVDCRMLRWVFGSDHCPIILTLYLN